jgi:hypothetical protein
MRQGEGGGMSGRGEGEPFQRATQDSKLTVASGIVMGVLPLLSVYGQTT